MRIFVTILCILALFLNGWPSPAPSAATAASTTVAGGDQPAVESAANSLGETLAESAEAVSSEVSGPQYATQTMTIRVPVAGYCNARGCRVTRYELQQVQVQVPIESSAKGSAASPAVGYGSYGKTSYGSSGSTSYGSYGRTGYGSSGSTSYRVSTTQAVVVPAVQSAPVVVTTVGHVFHGPVLRTYSSPSYAGPGQYGGFYGNWRARRLARIEGWGGFRSCSAGNRLGRMNARRGL